VSVAVISDHNESRLLTPPTECSKVDLWSKYIHVNSKKNKTKTGFSLMFYCLHVLFFKQALNFITKIVCTVMLRWCYSCLFCHSCWFSTSLLCKNSWNISYFCAIMQQILSQMLLQVCECYFSVISGLQNHAICWSDVSIIINIHS